MFYTEMMSLIVIDTFSKFDLAYTLQSINDIDIQTSLLMFISHFRIPQKIVYDAGTEFENNLITKIHKTKLHHMTPRYSNSNYTIERLHSTLLDI